MNENAIWFQKVLADCGVEATLEEAGVNYTALMVASVMVLDEKDGIPIDEAVEQVQQIAIDKKNGDLMHLAVIKFYLQQMLDHQIREEGFKPPWLS